MARKRNSRNRADNAEPEMEETTPEPEPLRIPRKPLTRGWRLRMLLQELANGEKTQQELAEQFGVTQGRISQVKKKYAEDIAEIQANAEDEFAGLWIARKAARLAELQADVERIDAKILARMDWDQSQVAAFLRAKQAALRAAAEELGQLPAKINLNVGGKVVTYKIDGVDMDELQ